jgi:hypothetical protein
MSEPSGTGGTTASTSQNTIPEPRILVSLATYNEAGNLAPTFL